MPVSAGDGTHILVSGRVQGVGYRYFAAARAKSAWDRGLCSQFTQWQRRGRCCRPPGALAYFIGDLERGPSSGRVRSCQVAAIPLTEQFSEFSVRY